MFRITFNYILAMEKLKGRSRQLLLLAVLFVVTLVLISFLLLDCSRLLGNYPCSLESTLSGASMQVEWTSDSRYSDDIEDVGENLYQWTNVSTAWWNDNSRQSTDANWEGRRRMHYKLRSGSIWYDDNLRNHFIAKLEARQFPTNCTKNTWVVHREHDSGLLSCTHVLFPIFVLGLAKGDGHSVIPVGQADGHYPPELPTFDGCGERKNRNIRCFYNITSCNIEDDPIRLQMLKEIDNSTDDLTGFPWMQLLNDSAVENGMIVLRSNEYHWKIKEAFHKASRQPRLLYWNEVRQGGKAGVHDKPNKAIDRIGFTEIDFVIHSMLSSWILQQTSKNVKRIANAVMAKYADSAGQALWTPPVLAVHVRQTDKQTEDPYYQQKGHYRSVREYAVQIEKMEKEYGFHWPSLFIISDSGSAMEALAQDLNDIKNNTAPDSENGGEGKRFIMYDWKFDRELIERMGGHTHIPSEVKYASQEHFLATLYIIGKIADYAIVQYSSNVGRFVSEIIGARHRLSYTAKLGPNAFSIDTEWYHD